MKKTNSYRDSLATHNKNKALSRYETAIDQHLSKLNTQFHTNLVELKNIVKEKEEQCATSSKELQSLVRNAQTLEQESQRLEQELESTKNTWNDMQLQSNRMESANNSIRREIEGLQNSEKLVLAQIEKHNAKLDSLNKKKLRPNDIKIAKNATERAKCDLKDAETEKVKQDSVMERLQFAERKLCDEIESTQKQLQIVKENNSKAKSEIWQLQFAYENAIKEKRDLLQRWDATMENLQRQSAAISSIKTAANSHVNLNKSMENEIIALSKQSNQKLTECEKIESLKQRLLHQITQLEKKLAGIENQNAEHCTHISRLAAQQIETDRSLDDICKVKEKRQRELTMLKSSIAAESKQFKQLGLFKSLDTSSNTDTEAKRLEIHLMQLSEENSRIAADIALEEESLNNEIHKLAEIRDKTESLCRQKERLQSLITQKSTQLSRGVPNMKWSRLSENADVAHSSGDHFGSESIWIKLETAEQALKDKQKIWMDAQNEIIRLNREHQCLLEDNSAFKAKIVDSESEAQRVDDEIKRYHHEIDRLNRSSREAQNQIVQLNELLAKKSGDEEGLMKKSLTLQERLIEGLQETESECVKMAESVEFIKREKDRIEQRIIESEQELEKWEEKLMEAKAQNVATISANTEGRKKLKGDISRLQSRLSQLVKQQEVVSQALEKSLSRREVILQKNAALKSVQSKNQPKNLMLQQEIKELHDAIDKLDKEFWSSEDELEKLRKVCEKHQTNLEDHQIEILQMHQDQVDIKASISDLEKEKFKNNLDAKFHGTNVVLELKDTKQLSEEISRENARRMQLKNVVNSLALQDTDSQGVLELVANLKYIVDVTS